MSSCLCQAKNCHDMCSPSSSCKRNELGSLFVDIIVPLHCKDKLFLPNLEVTEKLLHTFSQRTCVMLGNVNQVNAQFCFFLVENRHIYVGVKYRC